MRLTCAPILGISQVSRQEGSRQVRPISIMSSPKRPIITSTTTAPSMLSASAIGGAPQASRPPGLPAGRANPFWGQRAELLSPGLRQILVVICSAHQSQQRAQQEECLPALPKAQPGEQHEVEKDAVQRAPIGGRGCLPRSIAIFSPLRSASMA